MQHERFSSYAENRGGAPRHAAPRYLGRAIATPAEAAPISVHGLGRLLFLLVVLASTPGIAGAATWTVEWDPDDAVDRVGRVVAQASSGDSIVIGPGVYYEHILIDGKSLTFIGRDGAAATILDGSVAIDDRQGSIIYNSERYHDELRVIGITFRNGTGSDHHMVGLGGGAIHVWNRGYSPRSFLWIEDCVFEDNRAKEGVYGHGGAINGSGNVEFVVSGCRFRGNYASRGGSISSDMARTLIEDSEFELPTGALGTGSALFHYGGECVVQRCRFSSDGSYGPSAVCIESYALSITIVDCSFLATNGRDACIVRLGEPDGWGEWTLDMIFERNRMWTDTPTPPDEWTVHILAGREYGVTRVTDNVIVGCNVYAGATRGTVSVERNCFWNGAVRLCIVGAGPASCNVSWPDPMVNECHTSQWFLNVVADPMFCSDGPEEYAVAANSPCLPENSDGCGRIGQLEQGCGGTAVEPTTWGRIKNLYR